MSDADQRTIRDIERRYLGKKTSGGRRWWLLLVPLIGAPLLAWLLRVPLSRLLPIDREGVVLRIGRFDKGGISSRSEGTRQLNQFAIILEDGFNCEGTDSSFAAIQVGDHVRMRGYHDVRGWPLFDPEFWECDEAQLVELVAAAGAH